MRRLFKLRQRRAAPDYESLSIDELVQLARDRGINASSTWKPETIIAKLEKAS